MQALPPARIKLETSIRWTGDKGVRLENMQAGLTSCIPFNLRWRGVSYHSF